MGLDTPPVKDTIGNATIWRYMDLPRFVSVLATGQLWFPKAATLRDDPYEGFCNPPQRLDVQSATTGAQQLIAGVGKFAAESCMNARDHLYVNSWCLGPESMAMWKIYGSQSLGIAIKSSVDQYQRAARFNIPASHYAIGPVKYYNDLESSQDTQRDFRFSVPLSENLWNEVLKLAFNKRSCYEYETEWRAALYQDARPETGVAINFDLEELISAVYLGPRVEDFVFDAVLSMMDKFGLRKPLQRSVLLTRLLLTGRGACG
jgi:hypothetical protein